MWLLVVTFFFRWHFASPFFLFPSFVFHCRTLFGAPTPKKEHQNHNKSLESSKNYCSKLTFPSTTTQPQIISFNRHTRVGEHVGKNATTRFPSHFKRDDCEPSPTYNVEFVILDFNSFLFSFSKSENMHNIAGFLFQICGVRRENCMHEWEHNWERT